MLLELDYAGSAQLMRFRVKGDATSTENNSIPTYWEDLVQPAEWQAVCDTMTSQLRRGAYRDSTIAALKQLNELLQQKLRELNAD